MNTAVTPKGADATVRNAHPAGIVLVPCHDLARYHNFSHDLTLLDVPDGTEISFNRSASIVQNMNMGIETMMNGDAEWVWIIGDDHTFGRDVVMRLLDHNVDIVAPLCARRGPPFNLVVFDRIEGEDSWGRTMYHTQQLEDLPPHGLHQVIACGSAGMLIRRRVLEAIEAPWFENSDGRTTNEDMEFCRKAREAGFRILVDVETSIGHLGILAAWPYRKDGQWGLIIDFQGASQNQIFIAGGIKPDPDTGISTHQGVVEQDA